MLHRSIAAIAISAHDGLLRAQLVREHREQHAECQRRHEK